MIHLDSAIPILQGGSTSASAWQMVGIINDDSEIVMTALFLFDDVF